MSSLHGNSYLPAVSCYLEETAEDELLRHRLSCGLACIWYVGLCLLMHAVLIRW